MVFIHYTHVGQFQTCLSVFEVAPIVGPLLRQPIALYLFLGSVSESVLDDTRTMQFKIRFISLTRDIENPVAPSGFRR